MRGVSYEWENQENPNKTLGVIAQEVLEVVPDIVNDNGEYYGVNYSEFPALFIEAIKEQQQIIQKLQQDIRELGALVKSTNTTQNFTPREFQTEATLSN